MAGNVKVVFEDLSGEQYTWEEAAGKAEKITITLQSASRSETIKNVGVFALVYIDEEGKHVLLNIDGSFADGLLLQRGLIEAISETVATFKEVLRGGDDD